MDRSDVCKAKLERMSRALRHEEPDRVPVSDSFWGSFIDAWTRAMGLPGDTDIYEHYDLDWIVTIPNLDPHIKAFETLRETQKEIVVRTGFEAEIRKDLDKPMPEFVHFHTDTPEKMDAFTFDDPSDSRRFLSAGDNQIAGVGDGFERNTAAWIDTVRSRHPDIPVFGSVCEAHEEGWRIIGSENMMLWMGLYPDRLARFIERVSEYLVDLARAEIEMADGLLDGMVVFGDVSYVRGMLFSPEYWRAHFKPCVKAIVEICHDAGLPVIYHGCGDLRAILEDLIDVGIDALNPLEAKAGLDAVELRRQYGHRIAFCGNMDVLAWANLEDDALDAHVLRLLNAAKGGGLVFQSDHSVPASLPPRRYDRVVRLLRERGVYPLDLGPHDLPDLDP